MKTNFAIAQDFREPLTHLDEWHKRTGKPVLLADAARMKWDTKPGEFTRNEGEWYAETLAEMPPSLDDVAGRGRMSCMAREN